MPQSKIPWLTHPHPVPPLEGEGNSLSLRERVRPVLREVEGVRVGIIIPLCEPLAHRCYILKYSLHLILSVIIEQINLLRKPAVFTCCTLAGAIIF